MRRLPLYLAFALVCLGTSTAAESILNIYSARHYPSDEALYGDFTKSTGIRINRVDSDDAGILARLKAEGTGSPADLILLVDASRLWKGEVEGMFQPIKSKILDQAVPPQLRGKAGSDGSTAWFAFSTRARILVYDKTTVQRSELDTYEALADPKHKGRLCIRSGSHPYNLSLFSAMLEHLGEAKTQLWLKGLVDNMARAPKGGDTDQIRSVAAGECAVAVTNSYYLARIMRSDKAEDKAIMARLGVVFPNQASWGTHLNIAGGAVAKNAKNPANAIRFLEYLATPGAQANFADGNNEWPVAKGVQINNEALQTMSGGSFKADAISISAIGINQVKVQQLLDRVGFR